MENTAALATHLVALEQRQVVAQGTFAEASRTPQFQALLDDRDTAVAMPAGALRNFNTGRFVWLRADQVLLAAEGPRSISARNGLVGAVKAVAVESEHTRLVELDTKFGSLLLHVTPDAVCELELVPGRTAWALVKAYAG